jgi:hypothetical protein
MLDTKEKLEKLQVLIQLRIQKISIPKGICIYRPLFNNVTIDTQKPNARNARIEEQGSIPLHPPHPSKTSGFLEPKGPVYPYYSL